MLWQIRNGETVTLYRTIETRDERKNNKRSPIERDPHTVKADLGKPGAERLDVVGQVQDFDFQVNIRDLPEGVGVGSVMFARGQWWDITADFLYHHGHRTVRHYTAPARRRSTRPIFVTEA